MPGCSQIQAKHVSTSAAASLPQRIENTGPKSSPPRWRVVGDGARARSTRASEAAVFAGHGPAVAWRRRYQEWLEAGRPRAGTSLFARMPFNDSVKLAALAGTGRMTWPEINAALDAMIKLAAASALDGRCGHHAPATRRVVRQAAEDEVWARYHAQCDEVFASEAGYACRRSTEELWRTERMLDRLRSARDRELAALRRRGGVRPSAVTVSVLSPAERAALAKLDGSGFIGSESMMAAIDCLAGELAGYSDDSILHPEQMSPRRDGRSVRAESGAASYR